ncbi:MAG: hypothetical protein J5I53_07700 [Bradyrhizobiaceae bacterium]|nr:hypothetical protein [Bradyrhizobiaceae bacterium]
MDSLDRLLQKYNDDTAHAVEPVYAEVRALIHKKMKRRILAMYGFGTGAVLVMSVGIYMLLSGSDDYAKVIPHSEPITGPAVVSTVAYNPPALILNPTGGQAMEKDGHRQPLQMYVLRNSEAVNQLVDDQMAIAQVAQDRGDIRAAARAYVELARTLEVHGMDEKAVWASQQALTLAQKLQDSQLVLEVQRLLDSLGK